jgi:uncharacterized protein (DUF58 family)
MAGELLDSQFLKRLETLQLTTRRVFAGRMRGERRSHRRGVSIEFADYRDYVRGDDTRFIDWNIYGRLDRLFLKLYMEELDLYLYLLIDTSKSMAFGEPNKMQYAKQLAAALGYIGLGNLDKVSSIAFADAERNFLAPTRGKTQVWKLLRFLNGLEADGQTSLETVCKNFVARRPVKGIVVLLSDLLDGQGYENALRWFLRGNYEVYIIHLMAPDEIDPTVRGHLELIDSETQWGVEVSVTDPLLRIYKQTVEAFCSGIKTFCTRYGMNYVLAKTSTPFDRLILDVLRRRGLLR